LARRAIAAGGCAIVRCSFALGGLGRQLERAPVPRRRDRTWKFVSFSERDGVEPTNNHAERELRAFVLWRKRCFGTQSERGNLFAERGMTVAHTARKQDLDILRFLTDCCRARADGTDAPSLFVAQAERAAA